MKKFLVIALNSDNEICITHIAFFASFNLSLEIYLFYKSYIASLTSDEVFISVFSKYADFANGFYKNLEAKFLEHTKINNYVINLIEDQQSFYWPVYNLWQVEFKTVKTYIKINLSSRFIKVFNSPIYTFILFVKKSNNYL